MFPTPEILTRVHGLLDEAVRWGPALPVALVLGVALLEAALLPRRLWLKGVWVLVVVLGGVGAGALLRRDERLGHATADDARIAEVSALKGLWAQWDELAHKLPAAPKEPPSSFDSIEDALASLSAKVAGVGEQIAALKAGLAGRSIDQATAVKLADYLRQHGSYRVVVSCVPGDVEAYGYATQLVGILKAGGWDAVGPEMTGANVLEGAAMGVTVLIRDPTAPDAAKILLDAFDQLNIPHQPGISANNAIPDTATVELFVAKKP